MHSTPWSEEDLFFLRDMLRRGSSFAEIAGFVGRSELEVCQTAKELEARRKAFRLSRTGHRPPPEL
jgi:hypothetical protein